MRRVIVLVVALAACGGGNRVVVGAGTTLEDSGVLSAVALTYEEKAGVGVSVVGGSSANVLRLGAGGQTDVIITHHPVAEAVFLMDETFRESTVAFHSRFLLLAPVGSGLDGLTLDQALKAVAADGRTFVARRDGSGTAAYEEKAWERIEIDPIGQQWYVATGLGMGEALLVAAERDAVTLAEEGSYLQAAAVLDLEVVALADEHRNPYRVTLINERGRDLYGWLISDEGLAAIEHAAANLFGSLVFSRG